MQHITGTSKNTAGRRLGLGTLAAILALAVPAQLRAQVVEPAPGVDAATCAPAELTALQTELARARQEIAALRATGMEMQQSLEARDAALADLRSRNAALMAAADERAQAPADVAVRSEPPSRRRPRSRPSWPPSRARRRLRSIRPMSPPQPSTPLPCWPLCRVSS